VKKYGIIALSAAVWFLLAATRPSPTEVRTKADLGAVLFSDPILSEDQSISCASCHKPAFAFSDTLPISPGVHGRLGTRNAPSVMNMSSRPSFFWDGRAATLEQQLLFPIANPNEMNLPVDQAIDRLRKHPDYKRWFKKLYGRSPDSASLSDAIATFERTLETGDTPNDRWLQDLPNGMTEQQIRGRTVFREKAKCFECHFSPDFTGDEIRSIGLFDGKVHRDSGLAALTHNMADLGKFKVPGLRNIAVTAPYMHDGSMRTLREVIDYYDNPELVMPGGLNRDTVLSSPLGLTIEEKDDLEAFLHALTDDRFVH
jgi:cytochrome c peroxidase